MTSLPDRPNTAVLVVDVQHDVVAQAHDRDTVVANIAALVERARAGDVPVIWVQHSSDDMPEGSEGWQYVPELPRKGSEPLIAKRYGDSFEATDLDLTCGPGPLIVRGPAVALCSVLTGRDDVLGQLAGPGVEQLAARL